jgi:S-formylglutathione hydrolase FrmB
VACGQFDTLYGAQAHTLAGALAAAGMRTTLVDAPGTAHDWHTVQWVLRTQLDPIYRHLGLEGVS